ncbi:hypothetical protein QL285_069304 [Trifolium repens]|nr:hypothetical protein QL285_069304 [Trifolium repens]
MHGKRYWKVGEVYIPDKLDKTGKRFGFARFEDVNDRQMLLQKIEETWIGTYKPRANLPKFTRGEGVKKPSPTVHGVKTTMTDHRIQGGSKSFKEVVQGEEEQRAGIMEIEAESQNLEKLAGSYVGTLREIAEVDSIQTTIWMKGFQQIQAITLGMDLILLNSTIEGEIQRAYESNKLWWERWFLSLTPWRPDIRPRGRRMWVRLFGVPLHIWSWEGFKKIIWRYGKLLNLDPETLEQSRFDVARALIAVSYWEMVDEVIEVKVNDEVFIIRMIEERSGCLDLGKNKVAGSRNDVGESEYDSISRVEEDRSVMGVEEGWSENSSEGGSVKNDEEGGLPINITEGKTQEVIGKAVSIVPYEEREAQSQEVGGKRKTKGDGAVVEVADGDVVERREADCGSFCSAMIETPQIRAQSLKMLPQGMENGAEDKDADYCVTEACVEVGFVGDEASDVDRGLTVINEENIEVRRLKDKEVARLAEVEKRVGNGDGRKKIKDEGCRKLPLFFGPNKWANLAKAKKSQGGRNSKQKKRKKKGGKRGTKGPSSTKEINEDDDIQNDSSESIGDSCCGASRQVILVSNIQIVLNEGEVSRPIDDKIRTIRVEAERLFHIGLNLGITSNEERIGILDRMIELKVRDEKNFESDGGEEEDR